MTAKYHIKKVADAWASQTFEKTSYPVSLKNCEVYIKKKINKYIIMRGSL